MYLQRQLQDAARGKPGTIVDAVRKINPQWGDDLQNNIDFGPVGSRSGTSASPRAAAFQRMLNSLSSLANRNYFKTSSV